MNKQMQVKIISGILFLYGLVAIGVYLYSYISTSNAIGSPSLFFGFSIFSLANLLVVFFKGDSEGFICFITFVLLISPAKEWWDLLGRIGEASISDPLPFVLGGIWIVLSGVFSVVTFFVDLD